MHVTCALKRQISNVHVTCTCYYMCMLHVHVTCACYVCMLHVQ